MKKHCFQQNQVFRLLTTHKALNTNGKPFVRPVELKIVRFTTATESLLNLTGLFEFNLNLVSSGFSNLNFPPPLSKHLFSKLRELCD